MSAFAFSTVPVTASSASSALGSSIEAAAEALLRARDEVISALDRQVVELHQLHSALASAPVMAEMPEEEPYTPSFLVPETDLSPSAVANSLFAQAPAFSGPPLPPMMNEMAPAAPQAALPPIPPLPQAATPPPMPPQPMPAPMAMPQMVTALPVPELAPPAFMAPQVPSPAPAPQAAPPQMPASPTPLPGLSWAASPPPAFMPSLSSVAANFVPPQQVAAPPPELFAPAPPAPPMATSIPAPVMPEPPMVAGPMPPASHPALAHPATQQKPGVTTLPPPRGGITFTTFKAPPPAPVRQPLVPPPVDFRPAPPPPMPAHAGAAPAFAPLPLVESKIDPTLERATLEELNEALASAFSTVSRK